MWRRPVGPPHVWRVIDLMNSSGQVKKFSLQEIPENRYEEVIQHMCTIFARDEALCSSMDIIHDVGSMDLFREIWRIMLEQGISVFALELNDDSEELALAGVNVLYYGNNELDKILENMERNSGNGQKIVDFALETCTQVDPRTIYNVDCYLGGFGLSVDPKYRGMGLGQELLKIRDEIGRTYSIEYTSTIFTGEFSQRAAAGAGFETDLERMYDDVFDENGQYLFPNLIGKSSKVMGKRIS